MYVHPSERGSVIHVEKLTGASNYRTWRRDFEISLSARGQLGFITGGVKRDKYDKTKQQSWDTCNDLVISWILGSIHSSIKKSIMFISSNVETIGAKRLSIEGLLMGPENLS